MIYCAVGSKTAVLTISVIVVCSVLFQRHKSSHTAVHHAGSVVLWSNPADPETSERTWWVEERLHWHGCLVQEGH